MLTICCKNQRSSQSMYLGQITNTDFLKWDNLPLSINNFLIGVLPIEKMLTLDN